MQLSGRGRIPASVIEQYQRPSLDPPTRRGPARLWDSEQVALARLTTFTRATTMCVDVTEQAPDGQATVTFTEHPPPALGDEAVAQ
jgi:hypothetical protein